MDRSDINALAPRAATVRRIAERMGFALVGIAPAEPTQHQAELRDWLAAGKHGSMEYLARHADTMTDPRLLVPDARSVICLADRYDFGFGISDFGLEGEDSRSRVNHSASHDLPSPDSQSSIRDPQSAIPNLESPLGRIAGYAHGDDYHWVMKRRMHAMADELRVLWPQHEFRSCVDTAPIMEREHAARAGLGWVGKHTLLIHPQLGSWLYLGEIVTTLPIATSAQSAFPAPLIPPNIPPGAVAAQGAGRALGHCGTCTRCIDACPTQCITPYSVHASRCVSYLTIEHRGEIDPSLHPMMGDWLAGCDVCQAVCPFNQGEGQGPRTKGQAEENDPPFRVGAEGPRANNPVPPPSESRSTRNATNPHDQPKTCPAGSVHPEYTPRPPAPALPLLTVLNWSESDRQTALVRSALKRIKLDMWKRNALIAAGNWLKAHDDPALRSCIQSLAAAGSESDLVRATAAQVLARLTDAPPA